MPRGDLNHVEIPADDPERAKRFYSEIFGWSFDAMEGYPDYFLFRTEGGVGGAIGKRGVSAGQQLRDYVTVPSVDEALGRVPELGGTVVTPKEEVPGQGWYAVINDSEGNEIGLWENPASS